MEKEEIVFADWVTFYVEDPTIQTDQGYPTGVATVYAFVNRPWNSMNNDRSRPQSQLVDEAIVYMTTDYAEALDISKGKTSFFRWVCGHCGGGLLTTSCYGCGAKYRDNKLRFGHSMPIPRKVAAFLRERGHVFGQDPEIVWQRER